MEKKPRQKYKTEQNPTKFVLMQNVTKCYKTMRSDKLGSQIEKKVKPGFLLSLMFMFPELNTTKSDLTTFTSKTQVFCRPEWAKGGGSMKMNFDNFQIHI